jgi:hypothetical protein
MVAEVLVPLPDGRWLGMSREDFMQAVLHGEEAMAAQKPPQSPIETTDCLLTADQLEARTSVPASWWETAARRGEVPHFRLGKYVRFRMADAVAAYQARPTDCDSASRFARRIGSRA